MRDWMNKEKLPSPYPKVQASILSLIPLPSFALFKYDGELTYLWRDEEHGCVTANKWGHFRTDYPITDEAEKLIDSKVYIGELYVADGDLYEFLRSRKAYERLRLAVFDVQLDKPYYERYDLLEHRFPPEGRVHLASGKLCKTKKELSKVFVEAIDRGYEGIVARPIDQRFDESPYKVKKVQTADVVVIGLSKESKLFKLDEEKRMVGSVLVGCVLGDRIVSVGRVGSGFSLKERKSLYDALMPFKEREDEKYIYVKPALVIEVSFQEVVKSKHYEAGFAMRHPVFLRLRFDKKPTEEDCGLEHQFPNP